MLSTSHHSIYLDWERERERERGPWDKSDTEKERWIERGPRGGWRMSCYKIGECAV